MFRLFGLWEFGRRAGSSAGHARPATPTAYGDALSAGWVPPPPEIRVEAEPVRLATRDEDPDSAEFLARVYLHQQC